jgi:hypothetical protein
MTKKVEHLAIRSTEFHERALAYRLGSVLARTTSRTAVQQDGRTLRRRFRMWEDET